jgi:hypothetical protein
MPNCPNCGQLKEDGATCPNCGLSGLKGFPWLGLIVLIVVGMPGMLMGACGTFFFISAPNTFFISVPCMILGGAAYWLSHRFFNEELRKRRK